MPNNLKGASVFELDTGAFIAGASYKGEAEDRMKNIIKEIGQFDKAILFIDNIHALLDKQGATPGLANILKPELSRGELTIIGATTNDQYRKHIEGDEAFGRLFEIIKVEEPDEITASRMLNIVIPAFENHHNLKLADDVINESIKLAKRYLKERSLPDSAIDLIDRTMSAIVMMLETSKDEIESLEHSLNEFNGKKENLSGEEMLRELRWMYSSMKHKVSSVYSDKSKMTAIPIKWSPPMR